MIKLDSPSIKIVILGGLGEFGCNMMAIESGEDIVVTDAGLGFPPENTPGVEIIVPNISYLKENQKRLRAILITHGHEDHIGALPYLFSQVQVPIYAPPFAYHLIKQKIKGNFLVKDKKWLNKIIIGDYYQIGDIKVEFFPVNHSTPDSTGIILYTKAGIILHTGDFKRGKPLIGTNSINWKMLYERLPSRVRVLCSDSTYSIVSGNSEPDQIVEPHLADIVKKTRTKVFFSTFSSSIGRIKQALKVAKDHGRQAAILGDSMSKKINIARKLGYLSGFENTVISVDKLKSLPSHKSMLIVTGSQGEKNSVLMRLTRGKFKGIEISSGDCLVLSSSIVPGNELKVAEMIQKLSVKGVKVIDQTKAKIHVRGHALKDDLKELIKIFQPEFFIPIHGQYEHLLEHLLIAKEAGISRENIWILERGNVLQISSKGSELMSPVPSGLVYLTGSARHIIDSSVIDDIIDVGGNGVLTISLLINLSNKNRELKCFVDQIEFTASQDVLKNIKDYTQETLETAVAHGIKLGRLDSLMIQRVGQYLTMKNIPHPMIRINIINPNKTK